MKKKTYSEGYDSNHRKNNLRLRTNHHSSILVIIWVNVTH